MASPVPQRRTDTDSAERCRYLSRCDTWSPQPCSPRPESGRPMSGVVVWCSCREYDRYLPLRQALFSGSLDVGASGSAGHESQQIAAVRVSMSKVNALPQPRQCQRSTDCRIVCSSPQQGQTGMIDSIGSPFVMTPGTWGEPGMNFPIPPSRRTDRTDKSYCGQRLTTVVAVTAGLMLYTVCGRPPVCASWSRR